MVYHVTILAGKMIENKASHDTQRVFHDLSRAVEYCHYYHKEKKTAKNKNKQTNKQKEKRKKKKTKIKRSWVHTPQRSSYVPKNRVCLLVAYYRLVSRIGRVAKLHGVVKSSWVTQDTPVQKNRLPVLPPSTQPRFNLMCICLLSKGSYEQYFFSYMACQSLMYCT